ncbi:hypothetical protein RJ640_021527, partial [Escallonia rubra]
MADNKVQVGEVVPVLSKIAENKLNGTNYLDWSKTVRIYMRSIDKDDHLSNDPPTNDTKQLWLREDTRLILQIRNSIDSEILGLINHCEFVKELMDYLEFLYSGKANIPRIYDVCRAFYRPEKETKTLTAFFMDFKKTYEELNMLLPFSKDIKVQQAQREQMAVMSFLGALPREFDTAKSQILSGTDITSLQEDRNQRAQTTTATVAATSSSSPEKIVTISVDEYAKLSQHQESVAAFAESAPSPVTIADGSDYTIKGSGTVKPTSFITLSSVLSFPSPAFNLMSDHMTKQIIGKGHVFDGLYILDAWKPRSVACSGVVSPFEAHCRLGHPSLPVLKKLCPQFHDVSSVDCESCHFAKHHQSSLSPRVNTQVESAFELVHSDVWGPFEPSNVTNGANSGVVQSEDVDCLGEQAIIPSASVKPPIVQVYSRRREHHHTCPAPAPSSSDPPPNDLDLPIGLRK